MLGESGAGHAGGAVHGRRRDMRSRRIHQVGTVIKGTVSRDGLGFCRYDNFSEAPLVFYEKFAHSLRLKGQ